MIIDNIIPQGISARGAINSVKTKLAVIKIIENASHVDGAKEQSAIGL